MTNSIPEKITNFNVYNDAEKLLGVSGEVTLPSLEAMTSTVSGAGIAGEYESPTPGHFGSMETEIPYRIINEQIFRFYTNPGLVTLRGSQQFQNTATGKIEHRPLKITMKVLPKKTELGKLAVGAAGEGSNALEVTYIKIDENSKNILEYDKLNFVYKVNGVDMFAKIRSQI